MGKPFGWLLMLWSVPVMAQGLPPIPTIPQFSPLPSPSPPPPPVLPSPSPSPCPQPQVLAPPTPATAVPIGSDLRQLVQLFINESLQAGNNPEAVNYNALYEQLLAKRFGDPRPAAVTEYELIQSLLERYGEKGDRLLTPAEFNELLNRPRPPIGPEQPQPGVLLLRVPEITPNTPLELREILRTQDSSRGIILDLRGATGYDPQVLAATARLFLPPTIQPLLITTDRFGQPTPWNDSQVPLAADRPLIVLVDSQTQQGAVLLAAQLGLSGNTQILGEPTQGTEFQRKFFVLPSGAAVELTIARWQTGDGRSLSEGLVPLQTLSGDPMTWLGTAVSRLQGQVLEPGGRRPTIFPTEGRIGRFALGLDLREIQGGALGNVDNISAASGANVFQPNSDLRIFYIQDYVLFGYRPASVLRSFFANRIYHFGADAMTAEGIGIGASYEQVVQTYGRFGENGFHETKPFPVGSRDYGRTDRYYINYEALGLSFVLDSSSHRVIGIGLYKAGY
ncbi:MAG: S41 family peptidase [Thermostichales cyanobacterium GMQP_bins_62]